MDFYESDLESIIWDCLKTKEGIEKLHKKGLKDYEPTKSFRQLRIGNYGIADIVTATKRTYNMGKSFQSELHITVYELKKGEINLDALVQVFRYIKGIRHYFHKRGYYIPEYNVRGVLIGRSLNTNDWVYLLDYINNIEVYEYNYSIDGLTFKHKETGYYLKDNGFKLQYQ